MQGAGVGNVGVHAFLEGQLGSAAQVIPLPVPGTVGALAPVLLHVHTVDHHLIGGAFVEPGEVPTQHEEVSTHGQSQGHVIIVNNAAVGANGDVDAGLTEVLIPCRCHFNHGGGLTTADALGLPGDADGAAADAHLHEVRPGLGQEEEPVPIHHVAGTDLDRITVGFPHPADGLFLPAGIALGGVDTQHVRSGGQQGGDPLLIVSAINACTHQVPLLAVQQLQRILLVAGVVLAEHEVHQLALCVHNGQGIQLMGPDDVVGFLQSGFRRGGDQLFQRRHEGGHLLLGAHAADPVVTAGHNAQQPAGGGAVLGDGHGGVAVLGLQGQHICQGVFRGQIACGDNEACLMALYPCHHGGLGLDGLCAVDERKSAFLGQCDGKLIVRHGLHDSAHQRNVQGNGGLFLTLPVLGQCRTQGYVGRNAILSRVPGNQQILAEGVAGFLIVIRQSDTSSIYLRKASLRPQAGLKLIYLTAIAKRSQPGKRIFTRDLREEAFESKAPSRTHPKTS